MNILVSGATGFLGLHVVSGLLDAGHDVIALVRPTSDRARLAAMDCDQLVVAEYDGSIDCALDIFARHRPQAVMHLASLVIASVPHEAVDPLLDANITLGVHLLEGAVSVKTPYFINTGTFWEHYQGEAYNPVNLYAATKRAFQDILTYYTDAASLQALTLVLHDTYGPGDFRPKLFSLLRRAAAGNEILDMTLGKQVIDLIYVDDVVRAYCSALDYLAQAAPVGISPPRYAVTGGDPRPLREIIEIYGEIVGKKIAVNWGARDYREREMMSPWSGEPLPGWRPSVSLEEGIRLMEGLA